MRKLNALALQTRLFRRGESLLDFISSSLKKNAFTSGDLEGKVLAVTSKIVSLAEDRVIPKGHWTKRSLIEHEADVFLGEVGYGSFLTIKHGLFIPSAGIDESNSQEEAYILLPLDPLKSARELRLQLMEEWNLTKFGIIFTDSRTSILRAGVTGVALTHVGFRGLESKVGDEDLFGEPLVMTKVNSADALATTAVFCMGEADESCPLAIIDAPVYFTDEVIVSECAMKPEEDMYYALYSGRLEKSL